MISNIFLNPSPYAIGNYATRPKFHGRHIHNINTRPYHVHVFFWKRDDGWNSCPQRCSQKAKHCPLNQLHRSSDRKENFLQNALKVQACFNSTGTIDLDPGSSARQIKKRFFCFSFVSLRYLSHIYSWRCLKR